MLYAFQPTVSFVLKITIIFYSILNIYFTNNRLPVKFQSNVFMYNTVSFFLFAIKFRPFGNCWSNFNEFFCQISISFLFSVKFLPTVELMFLTISNFQSNFDQLPLSLIFHSFFIFSLFSTICRLSVKFRPIVDFLSNIDLMSILCQL